jgi:phosphohistidine phosphatase SixA
MRRLALILVCTLLAACALPVSGSEAALWEALRTPGHLAVMRHALAPGTGDPPQFDLADCRTQRNLSDEGRAQARRIGARFRANGMPAAQVYTSQWCRCRETAELLELGPVTELTALNSFFREYDQRAPQTRALREWITAGELASPVVLVTHQVNITALTGVFPSSGEIVVLRREAGGEIEVLGRIATQ